MKYVYLFNEGNKDMRDILGGKGANLAEMTNMNLPVPNGFTVSTEACTSYYKNNGISKEIEDQIFSAVKELEKITDKKAGNTKNPLLLSVRSGSPISMPGMMDTILNLGLNDDIALSLSKDESSKRFIYDSYRRLIMMFADVVCNKGKEEFEKYLESVKKEKKIETDLELTADDMYNLVIKYKEIYKNLVGEDFPSSFEKQLMMAVSAVFRSWNTDRAKVYRKINNIPDTLGTAVNVQEMVYGNLSDNSFTGVAFSRNPSTGENVLYGEYLEKAQGEDIVSGVRTPKSIEIMKEEYPDIYGQLSEIAKTLEGHYKDMQDMEFTVEDGKLYMLQTRNGKRSSLAALVIAVNMTQEGLVSKEEALMMVEADKIDDLLHRVFDENDLSKAKEIASGLPASPGAVSGKIYFKSEDVIKNSKDGVNTILVRNETSASDIEGMNSASGMLTVRGGMTSHAAVVARGLGKCCISGCKDIVVEEDKMIVGGKTYKKGSIISLDGTSGKVYEGEIKLNDTKMIKELEIFLSWAKEIKRLEVRANAEVPSDVKVALSFGAEGVGLARSEHMFFKEDKILQMRKMIIAASKEERQGALEKLLTMQKNDFEEILKIMSNKKVTVRYLDPPLHEFLPKTDREIEELAKETGKSIKEIKKIIDDLKEVNPMMGHRGCRLSITYPEIAVMQTKALILAAITVAKQNYRPIVEIMIPLVGEEKELDYLKDIVEKTAKEVMDKEGVYVPYKVGTMIEVPRAVVIADDLAKKADFFSFGTNDLTQMTYGFSRDDAGSFINDYYDKGILKNDPFKTIDTKGVGRLVTVATILARKNNSNIELGICGEHGGDPKSIEFFSKVGLDYVSCSPYRVPVAIVAAAQTEISK